MFKKALTDLKTSAPLKNSDRRKLKSRVVQEYLPNLSAGDASQVGDLLVPDSLQSIKFTSSAGTTGVAYLSADGEPLWFTLGKNSNVDLIPTVYTLWKRPRLLPILTTPEAVIPVLQNGADLMSAGVVEIHTHTSSEPIALPEGRIVAISQYTRNALGAPLAVGTMATSSDSIMAENAKGKAVKVLHIFKDKLWEMGKRGAPPEPISISDVDSSIQEPENTTEIEEEDPEKSEEKGEEEPPVVAQSGSMPTSTSVNPQKSDDLAQPLLDPQEVSSILRKSLIQSLSTTLSTLPSSAFPLLATTFYTTYILPARPAYVPNSESTPIDIKHSSHKNLSAFLRAAEKEGLLRLKEPKGKGGKGGDVQVIGVNEQHPDVCTHIVYKTIGDADAKREKKEEREAKERGAVKEIVVTELWKPHQQSARLFEECKKETSIVYSRQDVIKTLNEYISTKELVNPHQQQFINIDDTLRAVLVTKGSEIPEFMKRNELSSLLLEKMQGWYRIEIEGKDTILKKGKLTSISVEVKIRQGRKACTLITGYEPFGIDADLFAEDLRRVCAGSTAISDVPGGKGKEVMVQGKHLKTVEKMLMERGVPQKWIVCADMTGKKK